MSNAQAAEPVAAWSVPKPEGGKSRRAKALPPEERRQAIIEATLPLLMEFGSAVTTRQIANAAGIAEGTIFRAFPDKDALIEAVVEKALDPAPLDARLGEIDPSVPLEQSLLDVVQVLQERVINVWQLVTNVGFQRKPDQRRSFTDLAPLVALLQVHHDELRFDPASSARRLRALAVAGSHPALMPDRPLTAEEVVSMFLDGARHRDFRPSCPNS
jgi:AcrR family transcriptional regulator